MLRRPLELYDLTVLFTCSRTQFERVELLIGAESPPESLELSRKGRLFYGEIPRRGFAAEVPISLQATYRGNAPQIAQVLWIGEKFSAADAPALIPAQIAIPSGDSDLERSLLDLQRARVTIPGRHVTLQERQGVEAEAAQVDLHLFKVRRQALLAEAQVRLFFLELDERSNWSAASSAWQQAMRTVTDELFRRIEVRARRGAQNQVPRFRTLRDPAEERALVQALEEVSALFSELVDKHLPLKHDHRATDVDLVDWAFEQFTVCSAGSYHHRPSLQRQIQDCGVPNGAEFFKFAELALTCLDRKLNPDLWRRMLPALVRCTHLFVELQTDVPAAGQARMNGENHLVFEPGRYYRTEWREHYQQEYAAALAGKGEDQRVRFLTHRFTSILGQVLKDTATDEPDVATDDLDAEGRAVLVRRFARPAAPPA